MNATSIVMSTIVFCNSRMRDQIQTLGSLFHFFLGRAVVVGFCFGRPSVLAVRSLG